MNKTSLILILTLFLTMCKEKEILPPIVKTVSAVVQDDGSVLITGEILSDGGSISVNVAIGISLDSVPGENEIIIDDPVRSGNTFTAVYDNCELNTKYYFRALAVNQSGGDEGMLIMLNNIKPKPVVAPCSPAVNTVNLGMGKPSDNLTPVDAHEIPIGWVFATGANGVSYSLTFAKKPKTGIYTTIKDFVPEGKGVYVLLGYDFLDYPIPAGYSVYVNQTAVDEWDISICDVPFKYVLGLSAKLTMRFNYK